MGMVVRTNTMAVNANRQLGMNNNSVSKSLEKLSSGFKINRAGDDASGLAISEKMKAQIKGLDAAAANAQDGISMVQTAEGNLAEVHDMLNRMVELAEKSANGTMEVASGTATISNAGTDRAALQEEMNALSTEIDRIADSANFNNIKLFNGSLSKNGLTLQIGDTNDSFNKLNIKLDDMHMDKIFNTTVLGGTGTSAAKLAGISAGGKTVKTIDISDQDKAGKAVDAIKRAVNSVSTQRSKLGAAQNRLEHTINNLEVTSENMTTANSRIRDTDMAKEMMNYTRMNVLTQSAQAMLAQANQNPQSVLQLLQ